MVEWHVKNLTAMLKQHNALALLGLHREMIYLGKNVASEKDCMIASFYVKLHFAHDSRMKHFLAQLLKILFEQRRGNILPPVRQ